MTAPAQSVVIPVHDRAGLLPAALRSVQAQTVQPAEIIVIDDGSSDGSGEVARTFGCTVLRLEHAGVSAARNLGLRSAGTPRVAFLDSDDEWEPNHLAVLAASDQSTVFTSTAALTSRGTLIGSQRRRPLRITSPDRLAWPDNPVVTSGVSVDRARALAVGGFDEQLRHSEDLDLWARLLPLGTGLALPDITVRYLMHTGQISADSAAMKAGADRLAELGLLRPATRRAVETRDEWDHLRADGQAGLVHLARFVTPRRAIDVVPLLAHRALGRRIAASAPPVRPASPR